MKKDRRTGLTGGILLAAVLAVTTAFNPLPEGKADQEPEKASGSLEGVTVVLAGDSRSSADYSFYRELLEEKSGCQALVCGASGKDAAYNASDEYLMMILSQEHDFSIWLVGGNDTGEAGTVGTFRTDAPPALIGEPVVTEAPLSEAYNGTTFIQAVDYMMRRYKEASYDFRRLETGRVPRMIFCTDLPQQRDSKDSPWSRPENWERKRQAILECCAKNRILCLDLFALCPFDMAYEPMFTAPTDMVNNRGVYYMDGLHPNAFGMDLITNLEIDLMRRYLIRTNPLAFLPFRAYPPSGRLDKAGA